jgi:hypothetical protein
MVHTLDRCGRSKTWLTKHTERRSHKGTEAWSPVVASYPDHSCSLSRSQPIATPSAPYSVALLRPGAESASHPCVPTPQRCRASACARGVPQSHSGPAFAVCSFETASRCEACFSLPRAQRGSVSERLAEVCGLSPSPRHDWRVSRPAARMRPAQGARPAARRGGRRARPGRAYQREGSWGARGGRTRSVAKAV